MIPLLKRGVLVFIAVIMLGGALVPERAYAIPVNIVADIPRLTKDWGLDVASWFGGNTMIQAFSTSFLNQLLTGTAGGSIPPFISNLQGALLQTGDAEVRNYMTQLRSSWSVNSPFRTAVLNQAEQANYRFTGSNAFNEATQFTLGEYTNDVDACLRGDIVQAGLPCLLGIAGSVSNEAVGSGAIVGNQLASKREGAESKLSDAAKQGNGYLGNWSCGGATGGESSEGKLPTGQQQVPTGQGGIGGSGVSINVGGVNLSASGIPSLVDCILQTPGATIAALTNQILPANLLRLIQSDEISETIAALAGQMLAQTLTGGGLLAINQPSGGTGRTPLQQATDATNQQANQTVGESFLSIVETQRTALLEYQAAWQKIGTAASQARATLESCNRLVGTPSGAVVLSTITDSDAALARTQSLMQELERLQALAETAAKFTGGEQQAGLISAQYQQFAASAPSSSEVEDARAKASEDDEESLYNQLLEITQNGCSSST